jgi:hypothetical protein
MFKIYAVSYPHGTVQLMLFIKLKTEAWNVNSNFISEDNKANITFELKSL